MLFYPRTKVSNSNCRGKNTVNLTKNPGRLLLGIWLIVTGLLLLVSIPIPAETHEE